MVTKVAYTTDNYNPMPHDYNIEAFIVLYAMMIDKGTMEMKWQLNSPNLLTVHGLYRNVSQSEPEGYGHAKITSCNRLEHIENHC